MREQWEEFVVNRIEGERRYYNKTEEGRRRRTEEMQMYARLETNLTPEQNVMVDEVMFARCVALELDGERLYQQGMRDAIWLLKKLGVLELSV